MELPDDLMEFTSHEVGGCSVHREFLLAMHYSMLKDIHSEFCVKYVNSMEAYPEVLQKHEAHILQCDACQSWLGKAYRSQFKSASALALKQLYTVVDMKLNHKPKPKLTPKERDECEQRLSHYCCRPMFSAVELNREDRGVRVYYSVIRGEGLWNLTWPGDQSIGDTLWHCPWCGQKMPEGEFVPGS